MSFKDSKIVIVGTGNVGATTAFSIINQGLCERLVLIDMNQEKAYGEMLDLQHSVHFMNRNIKVQVGEYKDCADADVVIITAAAPMDPNATDRLTMLAPSKKVMKSIIQPIMESGFNGILVVISNPVDIMTYYAWKLSGLPKKQVIGSGTTLDSARLACSLAKLYDLDSKSVEAFVMGEHGDSEIVAWSTATIGGKNVADVMSDNASRTKDETFEKLRKETIQSGWEIFSRKHNTSYGIAASVTAIVKSIKEGAKEIVEIRLDPDERKALEHSASIVRSYYDALQDI